MVRTGRLLLTISLVLGLALGAQAQTPTKIRTAASLPGTCSNGSGNTGVDMIGTTTAGVTTVYICTATNTWDAIVTMAVALTWASVSGADQYNVYRASVSGGPYTLIKSGVTDTSYLDMTVVHNTTYYYVVRAQNSAGESSNSNQTTAVIPL